MQDRLALHTKYERRPKSSQLLHDVPVADHRSLLRQLHLQLRGLLHHGLSLPTNLLDTGRQEEREDQSQRDVRDCDHRVDRSVNPLGFVNTFLDAGPWDV